MNIFTDEDQGVESKDEEGKLSSSPKNKEKENKKQSAEV